MSTQNICFHASYEYPEHMFSWRNGKLPLYFGWKKNLLLSRVVQCVCTLISIYTFHMNSLRVFTQSDQFPLGLINVFSVHMNNHGVGSMFGTVETDWIELGGLHCKCMHADSFCLACATMKGNFRYDMTCASEKSD